MNKINLSNVTLLGVDCVELERLIFAFEICQKHIRFREVKLLSHLPSTNTNVVRIKPINSIEEYSLFVMKELFKYINTTHALIIQYDGFILNPSNWTDEFLQYDYIGAPWTWLTEDTVGNGGFSLRSRRLLEAIANDNSIKEYHPEDAIICRKYGKYLRQRDFKFAPETLARKFSCEAPNIWTNEFGFHNADISAWNIGEFADSKIHGHYIEIFYELFPEAKRK
jgi:hypothetical protein